MVLMASQAGAVIKLRWDYSWKTNDARSWGYGIAKDPEGDFYIVGSQLYNEVVGDRYQGILMKISGFYQYPLWTRTINGTGASIYEDSFKAVAADPRGFGAVAGGSIWSVAKNAPQAVLAYYWLTGTTAWFALPDANSVEGVALSGTNWIFAAGIRQGGAGNATDIWVAKYGYDGTEQTPYVYANPFNVENGALAIAVDAAGFVYVAGYRTITAPSSQGKNIWLGKFDPASLNLLWEVNLDGPVSSTDYASGLAIGPSGEIYLSGAVTRSSTYYQENLDLWIGRIDDTGASRVLSWSWSIDGGERDNDSAWGVAVSQDGYLWATGSLDTPGSHWADLWLGKFTTSGMMVDSWVKDYSGSGDDIGRGLVLDAMGPVVCGVTTDIMTREGIYIAQFREWFPAPSLPPDFISAYPNPFRPGSGGLNDAREIVIRSLPSGCVVRFYTLSGVQVRQITDWDKDGKISWDAKNDSGKDVGSGVYIFAATAPGSGTKKGKVVIIR